MHASVASKRAVRAVRRDIREATASRRTRTCAESGMKEEADEVTASSGGSDVVIGGDVVAWLPGSR